MRDVEDFVREKELTDLTDLLKKGAKIAANPTKFEEITELAPEELDALRTERDRKWKHPTALYFTVIVCSIGAAVQGWDQTGSNGANLSFPTEFGIGTGHIPDSPTRDRDNWLVGLVNAGPYIGSAFM